MKLLHFWGFHAPLLFVAMTLIAVAAFAAPADPAITAQQQREVVEALAKSLRSAYVFPDVGERVAAELAQRASSGAYAGTTTSVAFAKALNDDLRALGNDGHFRVRYAPGFVPEPDEDRAPTRDELARMRDEARQEGFGVARVERLPGNVGYLDLRGFGPAEIVGEAYASAVALLAGTDALILDLRRNGGGDPAAVALLMSHFFAEGDQRHVNDIYNRPKNSMRQYWTSPVNPRYLKPVYVLTSSYTFSGGEECAYDFQTQKRATLVGETTGGGANPGDMVALAHGVVAFVPTGRAVNPVTGTNWEHVGVKPDVAMPAVNAKQYAYGEILRAQLAKATDDGTRGALQKVLARVEAGDANAPDYAPAK